jgi:recombination associated protein RdgC
MLPRHLTLFRFSPAVASDLTAQGIAAQLAKHQAREPGPLEAQTCGFASPYAPGDDRLTVVGNGCTGFVFQHYERILPAASVSDAVLKKVRRIAEDEGRRVYAKERKSIREDVLNEMLPNAPVRPRRIAGWIDTGQGWLVIDTSSRRNAEQVLTALRHAFGSFPAVPLAPEESPRALMTDWLANDTLPATIGLGDECEMRDASIASGAVVRCRRQTLDTDEVKEHLRGGKQVFQLGLVYDDRMSLVLSETLAVMRLRALDLITAEQPESESRDAQVESNLALATLEVRRLLGFLERTFNVARPAEA